MHRYAAINLNKEKTAKVLGVGLAISLKQSVEICSAIRNKPLEKAKQLLTDVTTGKTPIAYTRFNKDVGHKTGMGPGRYPVKAAGEFLKLLQSAESNAQFKGLNTAHLIVQHALAQNASRPFHAGRKRRRRMKRAHIQIVIAEKGKK